MKRLKIYPKTFFYTLGLLLFIILVAHSLLYFLTPQVPLDLSANLGHDDVLLTGKFNLTPYITQMILQVLPISLGCCVLISILCSLLFSKQITVPIKQISAVTKRMAQIAKARGTIFKLDLSDGFSAQLPPQTFTKAVSNVLANAVAYTEADKTISIYFVNSGL